ncbi:MAG: Asp-tRNA(Asn)/Glu-tRNA(Gln) amidotransferase subunit GatC [Bdellovibrionales bacterium]
MRLNYRGDLVVLYSKIGDDKMDSETIKNVAKLAKLEVSEKQLAEFSEQFSKILDYVEKIKAADIEKLNLTNAEPMPSTFRQDLVTNSNGSDLAMLNAPEKDGSLFRVPPVVSQ